ncbi:hypothetical protein K470DRAFT_232669 [Piedraia hortae CBS 480.64]|uniref:Calcium permease family membrane transporter n=1 Tax=Piedraia hortae CBS 480.64 TaxID=1314780 RepID=A0A6A7BYI7_9PEZI|nr:hypothetical protein K470DRAFT_232669 [Piedraia hortae CBS 480.64]
MTDSENVASGPSSPSSPRRRSTHSQGRVGEPKKLGAAGRNTQQATSRPQQRPSLATMSSAAPHRGQEFSVDDNITEIEGDLQQARARRKEEQQRERQQLRRKASTLRRKPYTLSMIESEDEPRAQASGSEFRQRVGGGEMTEEPQQQDEDEDTPDGDNNDDDDDDEPDLSDAESFTLKDRQQAINETHPFGIRIWKPALYKKHRSVQTNAEGDIHSAPGGNVSHWLWFFNGLWTLVFGWWLAILAGAGGIVNLLVAAVLGLQSSLEYGHVLLNLASYLFYPFGKCLRLERDEAYLDEDEGEGRSISEYERWQTGDLEEGRLFFGPTDITHSIVGRRREEVEDVEPPPNETDSLLGRPNRHESPSRTMRMQTKNRLFGRGEWNTGRVIFFLSFYAIIGPCLFVVSAICWFLVFTIPMGKVTLLLFYHLRRHPLAMRFGSGSTRAGEGGSVVLCTYRAVGIKYWKYTIDGTNIFLINLLGLVVFAIIDYFVLYEALGFRTWFTNLGLIFTMSLASVIPLAYFIGQAVASISAQSSMGVGATINAFFSTVVEVFLYCVALKEGKAQLVEGSVIGSIFAGILFLPGLSMCFGAIRRKTQRFNVKSAGVTSNMLLFAVIGAFGPTLFYQIYGTHELKCRQCSHIGSKDQQDCRRCYFDQTPLINDRFFLDAVQPYIWFSAICLFLSYIIGLLFTLRTHAAIIWSNEPDEKKEAIKEEAMRRWEERHHPLKARPGEQRLSRDNIKDSQMYKRLVKEGLKQAGVVKPKQPEDQPPYMVPPKTPEGDARKITGLSAEDNRALVQQVIEAAATVATAATRDATKAPAKSALMATTAAKRSQSVGSTRHSVGYGTAEPSRPPTIPDKHDHDASGGHDAPNWSRMKSSVILLTATVAYAVIAEILVGTVDVVLSNSDIDEKFLGISLFSLVPNTTEFLNAISFAMNGNVALSMEIGSSYALQVMLLQIPCLVLFSALFGYYFHPPDPMQHSFLLLFPQWDMVTVILAVILMGWIFGEGKSNYFKGSLLIFTYLVVTVGFYFSGYVDTATMGVDRNDTLALGIVR